MGNITFVMQSGTSRVVLTAVLSFSSADMLPGDTLTLKDGWLIEWSYLGGSARESRIDSRNGVETFPVDAIFIIQLRFRKRATLAQTQRPNLLRGSNHTPESYPLDGTRSTSGMELPSGT